MVFQSAIVGGVYWLWLSTDGFEAGRTQSPGAVIFFGLLVAMLATGIVSAIGRSLRRRWRGLPEAVGDGRPEGGARGSRSRLQRR